MVGVHMGLSLPGMQRRQWCRGNHYAYRPVEYRWERVKRVAGLDSILHQARRGLDPLSGRLLERPPGFDPRLLPDPTTPIAPWVEQLIVATVNEAIAMNLPLLDALERLTASLERSGIILTVDDLQWLLGFNPGTFNRSASLAS